MIGWRHVFYITGSLGILLSIAIYFFVKDVPRGSSETELAGVETYKYKFSWKTAASLFKKRSLIMVFLQSFFGVFPWNVITYYIFGYLQTERGYDSTTTLLIMAPAVLMMAAGYPVGGWLGDKLFKRTKRGRLIASEIGVVAGLIGLNAAMQTPISEPLLFAILLCTTAFFMPFAGPNITSTMYDVTEPEVRSSADAINSLIGAAGAASAPLIAGAVADALSVGTAIMLLCSIAWLMCVIFLFIAIFLVPKDITDMHNKLVARAGEK